MKNPFLFLPLALFSMTFSSGSGPFYQAGAAERDPETLIMQDAVTTKDWSDSCNKRKRCPRKKKPERCPGYAYFYTTLSGENTLGVSAGANPIPLTAKGAGNGVITGVSNGMSFNSFVVNKSGVYCIDFGVSTISLSSVVIRVDGTPLNSSAISLGSTSPNTLTGTVLVKLKKDQIITFFNNSDQPLLLTTLEAASMATLISDAGLVAFLKFTLIDDVSCQRSACGSCCSSGEICDSPHEDNNGFLWED